MRAKIQYDFSGKLWKHNSLGGWVFVSLPASTSKEIRNNLQWQEEGWGRMKATATIRGVSWNTAIWYDKKKETYLLPIKAGIRLRVGIQVGNEITISISI